MKSRRRIFGFAGLALLLAVAAFVRALHVMPVGTGETRASADGRFTASVMDWSERGFLTNSLHRWFEYRIEGPGVHHALSGNPIDGPYFGSRSAHRVIRWSEDGGFVNFVFPGMTLRVTVMPPGPCRLVADIAGFDVRQTADGLLVRPEGWQDLRRPFEMTVSLRPGSEASPWLDRQVRVGADLVRYAVSREGGGSGGDAVTMRAERASKAGMLAFEWSGHADAGTEPDWTQAWTLLGAVECGSQTR
ncbi:Tsi3 family protein [Aureimonas ureilytica]|uniref:Tsi3 family protein n=1 Tax=Aureimonas ureilytica TaxID=401562 RepID=UPI00037237E4|nr:Tsi3 family protein [Aureimonas ureilytica]